MGDYLDILSGKLYVSGYRPGIFAERVGTASPSMVYGKNFPEKKGAKYLFDTSLKESEEIGFKEFNKKKPFNCRDIGRIVTGINNNWEPFDSSVDISDILSAENILDKVAVVNTAKKFFIGVLANGHKIIVYYKKS